MRAKPSDTVSFRFWVRAFETIALLIPPDKRTPPSFEKLCDTWEKFSIRSGASFSVEEYMTDRAYAELLRDYGEDAAICETRLLPDPAAVLKFDFDSFAIYLRSSLPYTSGRFIVTAEANFQSRQRFALSVKSRNGIAISLYRKFVLATVLKNLDRVHERVAIWDEDLCGRVPCSSVHTNVSEIDRTFNLIASANAEKVLRSQSLCDLLLPLKKEDIWFWARGVPSFDNLSSNGLSATIMVIPDATALIECTIELLKRVMEQLVEHELIDVNC